MTGTQAVPECPSDIVWDVTYTCPLRCSHCYTESGRRPSKQLSHEEMLRVADALTSLRPATILLAGGEPLAVRRLPEIVDRITGAGVDVVLYTSGWSLRPELIESVVAKCAAVYVSVDGPTAATHDLIRGRAGSFDRTMAALRLLDEYAADQRARGATPVEFGLDATVVRTSFDQLELFCTDVVPRFPGLTRLSFGAAMPIGLASRPEFVEHELLTDEQSDALIAPEYGRRLQSLAPPGVQVSVRDYRGVQYRPDLLAQGLIPSMEVEPDGRVRAMAIYEGTVGSLLEDPPAELWARSVARWSEPFVVEALAPVRTMRDWAEAARRIDYHYGTAEDRARIEARPVFLPLTPSR
ncbi:MULTISPECIES: radical SAM protein [unclassified Crossiella]|uniref:radical SAM protein n=1 Tax=unclassified Crossiella TaxID=2620835 RepID=UPI0020003D96|nr:MULTISPECIES: radical SAM protein [unclassified Crossiella]MCK2244163.1 radical SAM protein [Crossiella sp. S99.2]MCK2257967.1 radical SAM protein [Crossiella sp. S99.1]